MQTMTTKQLRNWWEPFQICCSLNMKQWITFELIFKVKFSYLEWVAQQYLYSVFRYQSNRMICIFICSVFIFHQTSPSCPDGTITVLLICFVFNKWSLFPVFLWKSVALLTRLISTSLIGSNWTTSSLFVQTIEIPTEFSTFTYPVNRADWPTQPE